MWHGIQMRVLFCSIFLINSLNLQGALLEVQINNISDDGVLHLAVYDSKEVFESDRGDKPGPQKGIVGGIIKFIKKGTFQETIELPDGKYAIGLYIDSNKNEKLDSNFFGVPNEQYGFSNNALGRFGPPSFESASFQLNEYKKISIDLK